MLPESETGKQNYLEMRDWRTRWRRDRMRALGGEKSTFTSYFRNQFAMDADLSDLREALDFAIGEGYILTPEMVHAAESAIAWGVELRRLLEEKP